jgi:hypothetical protein
MTRHEHKQGLNKYSLTRYAHETAANETGQLQENC